MAIKLKWEAVTTPGASILVYRSLVPITYENLPAVLATLPGTETEYMDMTSVIYTTYYYALGVKVGDNIALSTIGYVIDMPSNGPGNQTIIRGDASRGLMGVLTAAEFISPQGIIDTLGLTGSISANPSTTARWIKFVHQNKVKYIYTERIAAGALMSWNYLYNNGLVFGVDGPGPRPTDLTDVNQNRIITFGENSYRVRLPRNNASSTFDGNVGTDINAEWSALVRAMYNTGDGVGFEALYDYNPTLGFPGAVLTPCAEYVGNYAVGPVVAGVSDATYSASAGKLRSATGIYWRPVLELVV